MELGVERHKTLKSAPEDVISNMPDIVITNILDRLSLQDAVRTSILSKNWRFKWTMLSQLVFDDNFFEYLSKTQGKNNQAKIISRILHHLRGSITKFVLFVEDEDVLDAKDIKYWIKLLSRKGIKDLTLKNSDETPLNLPTHIFYCFELKHLKLNNCYFNPPPSFQGFPKLLSLELSVEFKENIELGDFFTRCPLLDSLTIDDLFEVGIIKVVDIAKCVNLKVLSLKLCDIGNMSITSSRTIFELMGALLKLQELDLDFQDYHVREGGARERFNTIFPGLKVLKLSGIYLENSMNLSCAYEVIRCFPNLQTLEITTSDMYDVQHHGVVAEVEYINTKEFLQLQSVVFTYFACSDSEVCLIKYLLGCSPFLKRIVICPHSYIASGKKFMFATKLLKLYRASPAVEINLS